MSRPTALVKDFLKRSGSRRAGDRLAQRLAWGLGGVAVVTAVVALARGKGVLVAAGALVLENTVIPDGMVAMGVPAKVREAASPALVEANRKNAEGYVAEATAHAEANK